MPWEIMQDDLVSSETQIRFKIKERKEKRRKEKEPQEKKRL